MKNLFLMDMKLTMIDNQNHFESKKEKLINNVWDASGEHFGGNFTILRNIRELMIFLFYRVNIEEYINDELE